MVLKYDENPYALIRIDMGRYDRILYRRLLFLIFLLWVKDFVVVDLKVGLYVEVHPSQSHC